MQRQDWQNNICEQNLKDFWDYDKWSNIYIIGLH